VHLEAAARGRGKLRVADQRKEAQQYRTGAQVGEQVRDFNAIVLEEAVHESGEGPVMWEFCMAVIVQL